MDMNNTTTTNIQNNSRQGVKQQKKKRCHGNRSNQRFRRKCRAHGMQPENIQNLVDQRNATNKKPNRRKTSRRRHVQNEKRNTTTTTTTNLQKRKRDMSSISITQALSKKVKNNENMLTNPIIQEDENIFVIKNYQQPMYLKRTSFFLFQMLHKQLNYKFKKSNEKGFIHTRLELLDQQHCLEVDLKLWQTYLDIGIEHQIWPDQLIIMAKTHDFDLCQQYLVNYIEEIKTQLNHLEIKLNEQSTFYPITSILFDRMEQCLKELVNCQRKYLSTKNNQQLLRFKDDIEESKLFEIITVYYPTIDQNQFVDQLIKIREKQVQIWEEQLLLEIRILCQFLPLNFNYLQEFINPINCLPLVVDQQTMIQVKNESNKIIQNAKRRWLHILISANEIRIKQYDQQYEEILKELEMLLVNNTSVHGSSLFNDINRYMMYRTKQLKQKILDKISTFRSNLLRNRQRSSSTTNMIGVSPVPYLDLNYNPFNTQEWQYLSLGPSFIRLNQSALRPRKQQNKQIEKVHEEIFSKVQKNLVESRLVPRTQPIFQEYADQLHHYIEHAHFVPLSYKERIQTEEQAQITASIQKKLKRNNLVLCVTDKSNNFYIGSANEFNKKVHKYFMDTHAFIELTNNPLNELLNKVITLLNHLHSKKLILKWQHKKMLPDRTKCKLAHVYFKPKTHKDDIPLRPIQNTILAPTANISKLLDKILRPIFDKQCYTTTIIDGGHLITTMNKYIRKGLFKPSTLFCTFDIHNLYTMLPQDDALNDVMDFLHAHGYRKVKGINIDTIRKLASIVIKENVFVYGHKIYQQTIGGAMGSSFTLTLANIFMWKWQKEFVRQQDITGEIFGRYIDDIFITWNRSEAELIKFLNEANQWHPNIKLDYQISQRLPFLDVRLINNNGILETSVYHKPTTEPYVVPFISDHPYHVFSNIIQTALVRAIRYSSTFKMFNHERINIKLMLLYNGYPSSFIDEQFQKVFNEFNTSSSSFLTSTVDRKQFSLMREKITDQPTTRQSQVAISAATANIDNNQTDDTQDSVMRTEKKLCAHADQLFIHYTHEKRFTSMKRDMHQVYDNVFKNTPATGLKLVVGNRNRRNAKGELIRNRPKRSILYNIRTKNKYLRFIRQRRKKSKTSILKISTDQS